MRGAIVQQRKQLFRPPVSPLPPEDAPGHRAEPALLAGGPALLTSHGGRRTETKQMQPPPLPPLPRVQGSLRLHSSSADASPWPLGAHRSAEKAGHCQGFISAHKAGWVVILKLQESHKSGGGGGGGG